MTIEELKKLIDTGEKIDIEFKKSHDNLNKDLYETVCSFNNRDGGHIFLGIVDETKEICGVNSDKIDKMKKDFTTAINNSNKINPPMYLVPEDYEIDGKRIIYIRVPEGTQVTRLNGRIFDRTYEGDIDITDNAELVYKMYARKQSTYFVNKVYPNLGLEFLDFDVIKRAKKLAMGRVDNHAWIDMNEEEILRSLGLILTDSDTGKEGITLAAILLFGKDSTIMSVLPQYKTDAIYRVKNMDRYDDREVIITNLIDSFRRLMDFGKKHLNDVFVLDGDQSVSARDKILREIISNILAHRDYSSAYSAKFVIEKDNIYTENSNLPHGHGELQLNKFKAFPKNPAISKVFREIGYADELGSGMRNTNKYTKLYSGGTPAFIEDNIFQITIPIDNVANLRVGPTAAEIITRNVVDNQKMSDILSDKMSDKMSDMLGDKLTGKEKVFLEILIKQLNEDKYVTTTVMSNITRIPSSTIRRYMKKFCELGILVSEGKNKSTQYRLKEI